MKFKNWIKWLLIRKGSKIVTINDRITDIQTVSQKISTYKCVFTHEWNNKIAYDMDDIRLASRKEIKAGRRL